MRFRAVCDRCGQWPATTMNASHIYFNCQSRRCQFNCERLPPASAVSDARWCDSVSCIPF